MTATADGLANYDEPENSLQDADKQQFDIALFTEKEQHSTQTGTTETIDNAVGEWLW